MTRPYRPEHVTPAEWLIARSSTPLDPEACWTWTGSTNGDGYGKLQTAPGRLVLAHRHAYETFVGPIPEGMTVDHLCNTRLCVRPSHMELVTHSENVQRGYERRGMGRARKLQEVPS